MRNLKTKSDLNLLAARTLIEGNNNYYASSVHCSYYGCFQFIMCKLDKIGFPKSKIDSAIAASKTGGARRLNSHTYPIELIVNELRRKVTSEKYYFRDVDNLISDLKKFREDSDYQDIYIDDIMSDKALRLSTEIIRKIEAKL